MISGATSQSFTATEGGRHYMVEVTDDNDCSNFSDSTYIGFIGILDNLGSAISIYPNPSNGAVNIEIGKAMNSTQIDIINELGQIVYSDNNVKMNSTVELQTGVYVVRIQNNDFIKTEKLVITK